jgi:dTDP-4-dehydrorhamnose reductase
MGIKTLLLGADGQVGWELRRTLASLGELAACGRKQCDLRDPEAIKAAIRDQQPDLVVNAAAYNAVDRAEKDFETALAVNGTAPGTLAVAAREHGAGFIHYSTDFVFDGQKTDGYIESDPVAPLSAYGRSKLAGEQAVQQAGGAYLVLRTSWVYSTRRPSFVTKVQSWARKFPELRIVTDQTGSPTWARMLAEITGQIAAQSQGDPAGFLAEQAGIYHLGGSGACSRFEWAEAILELDPDQDSIQAQRILPTSSDEFPTPATRPANSVLINDHFASVFNLQLPHWRTALSMALNPSGTR